MKKLTALLLALLLVLGGFAALAEAEPVEALELAPVDESMALDEVALEELEIGEVTLGDIGELALPEVDGLLSDEAVNADPEADSNASKGVKISSASFPDAAFRKYVRDQYDANGNGYLSSDETDGVTGMWLGLQEDYTEVNCKNVKGIQYFPNLEELFIIGTDETTLPLTSLDVSKNANLVRLYVCFTKLGSLDVSKNANLEELNVGTNKLKTLTLGKQQKLTNLVCDHNRLTKLDVTGCPALNYLQCDNNKLTKLDVSKCTRLEDLICCQNKLAGLSVTRNTALTELVCWGNPLGKLDVSKNTKLVSLDVGESQLKALDVSKNTKLQSLRCGSNQLKQLDVSKNTSLWELWCDWNQLTALDVRKLTKLTGLRCTGNVIPELDISSAKLKKLVKEVEPSNDGNEVVWEKSEDYGLHISASTTLKSGSKILYQPE